MNSKNDHRFRPEKLPRRAIEYSLRRAAARESALHKEWSSHLKHKHVVSDAIAGHLAGQLEIGPAAKASLAALEGRAKGHEVRDLTFGRPHTFDLHPGLNVLAPPYDFTFSSTHGRSKPSVQTSSAAGTFGVVASAVGGPTSYSLDDSAGAAGVGVVIVPSHRSRTLSIRPYFQWSYVYTCESIGWPTANCRGYVNAAVTGHRASERFEFPLKDRLLFTNGSDLWSDTHGTDADVFRNPDAEHIVSGFDYYTVLYACRGGVNSARVRIGYWSQAFIQMHCSVPFIAIREF